ncbi:hypothetical protein ACWGQT_00650 [Streptomyces yangpuensis]
MTDHTSMASIYVPLAHGGWAERAAGRFTITTTEVLTRELVLQGLAKWLETWWAPHEAADQPYVPERVVAGVTLPGVGRIYADGMGKEVQQTSIT